MSNTHTHIRTDTKYIYIQTMKKKWTFFLVWQEFSNSHHTIHFDSTQSTEPLRNTTNLRFDDAMWSIVVVIFLAKKEGVSVSLLHVYRKERETTCSI